MPVRQYRRRYLALKIYSESIFNEHQVWDTIKEKITFLYGVKGLADIQFKPIEYNQDTQQAIIRCRHDKLTETKATLAHIATINKTIAKIQVTKISGTIKTLKKKTQ